MGKSALNHEQNSEFNLNTTIKLASKSACSRYLSAEKAHKKEAYAFSSQTGHQLNFCSLPCEQAH